MFPNLDAEQARHKHTNEYLAKMLGVSRQLYDLKKKRGGFKFYEIKTLLDLYGVKFEYLFAHEDQGKTN